MTDPAMTAPTDTAMKLAPDAHYGLILSFQILSIVGFAVAVAGVFLVSLYAVNGYVASGVVDPGLGATLLVGGVLDGLVCRALAVVLAMVRDIASRP